MKDLAIYPGKAAPVRQAGLSMIELMVALAILGVLIALAAPSMQSFMASQRLGAATNELMGQLALARTEALRRGTRVTLCKRNGDTCTTSGNWSQGWLVFTDSHRPDSTAQFSTSEQETLLMQQTAVTGQQLVVVGLSGTVAHYVSFEPSGRAVQMNGDPIEESTLRVCSTSTALSDAKRARDIVVLPSGRAMVRKDASGNPLKADGQALSINSACGVS